MESLLTLYNQPYDPTEPTLCFDERPCFLIGDTVLPLPMTGGNSKREHYEYEKLGSCVLMVAVDPRAGWRFTRIFDRRRKQEYAQFMKELMDHYAAHRPEVRRIHLVQDNLNTHHAGSFYEQFDAGTAHALQQFYRFHFTPKGAVGSTWSRSSSLQSSERASPGGSPTKTHWSEKSWLSFRSVTKSGSRSGGSSR